MVSSVNRRTSPARDSQGTLLLSSISWQNIYPVNKAGFFVAVKLQFALARLVHGSNTNASPSNSCRARDQGPNADATADARRLVRGFSVEPKFNSFLFCLFSTDRGYVTQFRHQFALARSPTARSTDSLVSSSVVHWP